MNTILICVSHCLLPIHLPVLLATPLNEMLALEPLPQGFFLGESMQVSTRNGTEITMRF